MSTKILDLIAQLEAEIFESPKPKIGGAHKRIVDYEHIKDLIGDIRVTIPDEIRVAQSVLNERDMLLNKASLEAKSIYETARNERDQLVREEEVYKEATKKAREITQAAREAARSITMGACSYADDILLDLLRYINDYSGIIDKNRLELQQMYAKNAQANVNERQPVAAVSEEQVDYAHAVIDEGEDF